MELVELIARAPQSYREIWPHEYVVIKKDGQRELLAEACKRFCSGERWPVTSSEERTSTSPSATKSIG